MRREFGGCAGNIAYNLKMLGGEPLPMATVGSDAQPYLDRLDALGISRRFIRQVEGAYTAQAFITTDMDDNQITAFHPGAMSQSHLNAVPGDGTVRLAIVAPDGRDGMLQHAQQLADHGIPFIFDPGQGMPMFSGEELLWFIQRADYVAVNDYEAKLLAEKTGLTLSGTQPQGARADRDARRGRIRDPRRRRSAAPSPWRPRASWSTPPGAATPTGPG